MQDWEGGAAHKDRASEFTYSTSTGNLIAKVERGEVIASTDGTYADTGSDARFTAFTYSTTTTINLSLPTSKVVKNNASSTVAETKFYYDSQPFGSTTKGNLTKDENWISGSTYASSTKTYTTHGLVATSTDPRGNATGYLYDSFNLYPATTTNALGHVTGALYDYAKGAAKRVVDPDGLVRTTSFDPVGRVTEEKQPDLTSPSSLVTSKLYTYTDTFPTSVRTRSYLTAATTTDLYAYRDGLRRPLQDRVQAGGNNTYAVKDYVYGSAGQLAYESLPYFASSTARSAALATSSQLYITHDYDALSRASSTATSVGTTRYTYTPWKTRVTDANGNPKDMHRDAFGNLSAVAEYNDTDVATTTYAYDALQNLTSITDALANVRNFTYDGLSRRTAAQDLHDGSDATYGTWTYGYDPVGNLASSTDPKGQVVNYTYDNLNRVTAEDYTGASGTEVSYLYDFCTYGKGKLCTASSTEAFTSSAYNALGLPSAEAKRINGIGYASTTFAYDRAGNPTTITYPDGREVDYGYDAGGKIYDIKTRPSAGTFSDILSKAEYAPHGQVSLRSYGNGVEIPYSYLATQLYRLQSIGTLASSTDANSNAIDLERGSSQYLSITDANQTGLDFSDALSFGLWVKFENDPSSDTSFISKRQGSGSQRSYLWYMSNASTMTFESFYTGNSAGCVVSVTWDPSAGTWYHVALTKSGTSVKFYVNGAQQGATQTCTNASIFNGTAPFQVGGWPESSLYTDGLIDDVRAWSREVSGSEIYDLYSIPSLFNNGSNLQGWWKLNNAYTDASGNGNTLTANNSPVFSTDVPYPYQSIAGVGGIQYLQYAYDAVGNITAITDQSSTIAANSVEFVYDDLNRLTTAFTTSASSTPFYETHAYNALGNILRKGSAATTTAPTNTHSLDIEVSTNQYASISDANQTGLDFSDALTLAAWVKFESLQSSDDDILIAKRQATGSNRSYSFFSTGSGSENLSLVWWTNGSSVGGNVQVPWSPTTDTWYHVAVTKNGTAVKFYVNGAQQGTTQTGTSGTVHNGGADFRIGADQDDAADDFDGIVDDVRVWNRELSSTEVGTLYSTPGTFSNGTNLQGHWMFDNEYTDDSGNDNTLTGENSPIFSADVPYTGGASTSQGMYTYAETNYANPHAPTAYFNGTATTTYSYDNNGNLTGLTGAATSTFLWDYRNRMREAWVAGASTTYAYDHTIARMAQRTSTTTSHYPNKFYSIDYAGTSTTTATSTAYIWHGDTLVAYIEQRIQNGSATGTPTTHFVHPDHLGSTNVVTNASGTVVQVLDYYPYGGERIHTGTADLDRTFIGQFGDDPTALSYFNARYYDGSRGQFVSQDPVFWEVGQTGDGRTALTNPQMLNSYAYANGNPIANKDPTGRCAPICVIAGATALGGVGGFAQQGISDVVANYSANGFNFQAYQWSSGRDYAYSTAAGAALGFAVSTGGAFGAGTVGIGAIAAGGTVASDVVRARYVEKVPIDPYGIGFDAATAGLTAGLIAVTPGVPGRLPRLSSKAYFTGSHATNEASKATAGAVAGGMATGVYTGTQRSQGTSPYSPVVATPSGRGQSNLIGLYRTLISTLTAYRNTLKANSR